mgnify:FL=1
MPFLKTAKKMTMSWSEIWGYPNSGYQIEEAARAFIRQDDLTTQRELALMGE